VSIDDVVVDFYIFGFEVVDIATLKNYFRYSTNIMNR
jgi:hypothetical protein